MQNEWEFQGEVLSWVNAVIANRSLAFEKATGEFPNSSGKRSDVVIWRNRAAGDAAVEMELKTPSTGLDDGAFHRDAIEKAQHASADYIVLWNMREAALYKAPAYPRTSFDADDFVRHLGTADAISSVQDGTTAKGQRQLKKLALDVSLAVHDAITTGAVGGQVIDSTVFVDALRTRVDAIKRSAYDDFRASMASSRRLNNAIMNWARKQGIIGFVGDVYEALASQFAYRIAGQVLFYYSFRRQEQGLPKLDVSGTQPVLEKLRQHWDRVRVFDYEALYDPSPLESITVSETTARGIRHMVDSLSHYDWDVISLEVLGHIFEEMIPEPERIALGQYYTRASLADVLISLVTDTADDTYLDPGVGTGTFLLRAYQRKSATATLAHSDKLDALWGFDISAFPAELAVINLYRQDLANPTNFPRIAVRDFFEVKPGDTLEFPPARVTPGGPTKVSLPLPDFDAVVGNPPYVRSQQLDDLDAAYKRKLQRVATQAGIAKTSKFDAFAYFMVHAAQFLVPDARLGFVTSAAWLTAQYGAPLQRFLLDRFYNLVVLYSEVEPFFQAEVDTVVIVGRRIDDAADQATPVSRGLIRFVTVTRPLADVLPAPTAFDYWTHVDALTGDFETAAAGDHGDFRLAMLEGDKERDALQQRPREVRNWGRELRRSAVYDDLFGVGSA